MLSKFSVKKPYTVLVGVILAIVLGVVSFTRMTADLLPSISLPYVIIMTTYPGASPETVEMVVTKPVESAMATVSNIEGISSSSAENYSMVILEFSQSTDMNGASLEIRESLDQIKSYWDDSVGNPIIMKLNPDMLPVMIAAVGVEGMGHSELSTYVQEKIAPEIESIEGVASVSLSGLLEESVHVVINPDKVADLNKKIYAAIDDKMQEAVDELAEGKQQLIDSEKELEDGKKEILDGQRELNKGKTELEKGKADLEQAKKDTAEQLADTKNQLLTAKIQLESTKQTLNTDLTTAKALQDSIDSMDQILEAGAEYSTSFAKLQASMQDGEIVDKDAYKAAEKEINGLKKSYLGNAIMKQMSAASPQLEMMLQTMKDMDWLDAANMPMIAGILNQVGMMANTEEFQNQKSALEEKVADITNGMGYEAYAKLIKENIKKIDSGLEQIDSGLKEVEKGELTAALEFANAQNQINTGEVEIESAQTQLDTALEQLEEGQKQLDDAWEQIEEGEKQLEEARQEAYENANMAEVITVDMVKGLLTAQNFSMPAGYVTEDGVDYLVRVGDKPDDLEEMQAMPLLNLNMDGVEVITLADVADVFYTDNSAEIYTNVNGSVGCMLTIQKQTGYSTGQVSDLLEERFGELMDREEGLDILTLMDQGIYIDLVMDSIINNVLLGAALAILILIIFLRDIRPTLVIAISIPISLVTAIVCMYFSGVTLNVISLSGLALGIGMLVDNSIVVIENIYRLRGEGCSMKEAAIKGAGEVAGAILASTLTTVCVFLPIVFTDGITKQLFVDMGLTIAYSLLASLAIALTVVPAMASKMLSKSMDAKEGKVLGGIINGYGKMLGGALKVKALVFIFSIVLLGASIALAWTNGTAFMPDMDSTQLTVNVTLDKDATIQETGETTDKVVEKIFEIEGVESIGAMSNASSMSLLTGGGGSANSTVIYVVTQEDKTLSNEEIADIIEEKTKDINAEISIETSTMDLSALGGSGISIMVKGRDLDMMQTIANEVAAIVESVEGTENVSNGLEDSSTELRITIDKDKAIEYGLTVAQVYAELAPKLAESSASTTLVAADKDYSVYVEHGGNEALTRELLKELEIKGTGEDGKSVKVKLSELADFTEAVSMNTINRSEQSRYVTVSASLADGYNIGKVSAELEKRMESYQVPAGYSLVFSGENETINDAMEQVLLMLLLSVVFMYLIMVAQFQSLLSPFIIMFTIPLAFTGGFFGLYASGSEISVVAMIGFVLLSGIIVNNGIVLVDYINQLRESGMEKTQAIIIAGKTRLRPVLMTALTTILSLSTMVFSTDMGSEMTKPMAIVTIGGLVYGTLLTLFVIPAVYAIFIRKEENASG